MSAILLVLLSGLTMFGVSVMEPSEIVDEEPDGDSDAPMDPIEGGSNPLDEAIALVESESAADSDDDEDAVIPDPPLDPEADTIAGSENSDSIDAGDGDDVVDGREGDDSITGGAGADSIEGGSGADVLYGGNVDGPDDGSEDTLSGGEGDDEINLGDTDRGTGGAGADSFVRSDTVTSRVLVTDFNAAEDVIVVQHQDDTPPTLLSQTVATDGVILNFSDNTQIELLGLTEEVDESLISFVDTRQT